MKPSENAQPWLTPDQITTDKNYREITSGDVADLTASIKANGILQPLLVRKQGDKFQLVCGHRRLMAARMAGVLEVPVVIRVMSDDEASIAQIVENDQRQDAHPLDQAAGYQRIMKFGKGDDVSDVAARVGRSYTHVYDVLRLLELGPPAQKAFREGRFTLGHAILLSRLSKDRQKQALEDEGALFAAEQLGVFGSEVEDAKKARSIREFRAWIDRNVRLDPAAKDVPQLFPETAQDLGVAKEQAEKVVQITHLRQVGPDVKEGLAERLYLSDHWRDASGKKEARVCPDSVLGIIVIGPDRGTSLRVCVNKKCAVHWKAEKAAAAASAKGPAARPTKAQEREAAERKKRLELEAKREQLRIRFEKCLPEIIEATAKACAKASTKPDGVLGKVLVERCSNFRSKKHAKKLAVGKTPESLVRHCAFMVLTDVIGSYGGFEDFSEAAKALGVDLKQIMDEHAPVSKAAATTEGSDDADESGDE